MQKPIIIAAGSIIDGKGSLQPVFEAEEKLSQKNLSIIRLYIDPLAQGWDTPLVKNHFRSGCAPIEALLYASDMIMHGACDAAIIDGTDNLKTTYAGNKDLRQQLMNIYGSTCPLPDAYTRLSYTFIKIIGAGPEAFKKVAEKLYENCRRTAASEGVCHEIEKNGLHT